MTLPPVGSVPVEGHPPPPEQAAPPAGPGPEGASLRLRPYWRLAALAAFMAVFSVDAAASHAFSYFSFATIAIQVLCALAAAELVVAALFLRPRLGLSVDDAGVAYDPLVGRRRHLGWTEVGAVELRRCGRRRSLKVRTASGRTPVDLAERRVAGSLDDVVSQATAAGVTTEQTTAGPGAVAFSWGLRAVAAMVVVTVVAVLPVPGVWVIRPGVVSSAPAEVVVAGHRGAGGVRTVGVFAGPADATNLFRAWRDHAVTVGRRTRVVGRQPERTERHMVATAGQEATAAAFGLLGVPVVLDGAGAEVARVPKTLAGRLRVGDVIESLAGQPIADTWHFWTLAPATPGPTVLGVRRGERQLRVDAPAGWYRGGPVALAVGPPPVRLRGAPVPVAVRTSSRGNSAGLAWGLAVVERLAHLQLGRDRMVVVTGALSADGVVRPVGGIPQKAATVTRAGAKVFVVPASQAPAARAAVGPGVQVIGVQTLAEAVEVLGGTVPAPAR